MKKTINCVLLILLILPFTIGNNKSDINNNNDVSHPPISSGVGGLARVWEQEWTHDGYVSYSRFLVIGDFIYIVGTITKSYFDRFFLVKFSQNGSFIWERINNQSSQTEGAGAWSDGDNLYTIHSKSYDSFLTKWYPNGTSAWVQPFGEYSFGDNRFPLGIDGNNESLYLLAYQNFGFYISKWYLNGTKEWEQPRQYFDGELSTSKSLLSINNDSIYVFCKARYSDKIHFFNYAFNGTIIWRKEYDIEGGLYIKDTWADDDYFYMAGTNRSSTDSFLVVKFSQDGEVVWEKSFCYLGQTTTGLSVFPSSEGVYVGGGVVYPGRFLLTEWNQEGDFLWSRAWEEEHYGDFSIVDIQGYKSNIYTLGEDGDAFIITKWADDTVPPTLSSLEDVHYEQAESGFYLTWSAYDENPSTFTIYKDEEEISSGNWVSGEAIIVQGYKSSLGQYNYSIVVKDSAGKTASDSCLVIIEDTTIPVLHGNYLNDTGIITWSAYDKNPESYDIYKGGELVSSGSWVSGGDISIVADIPDEGFYNYTIVIRDSSGNVNSNSIIISAPVYGNNGGGVVTPFPWMIILLIIIGIAIITVGIIVIMLIRRNNGLPKEKFT